MGLIIDANCSHKIASTPVHDDFSPVLAALLKGSAKLVYGGSKLLQEYNRVDDVRRLILRLDQAGRTLKIKSAEVDQRQNELEEAKACTSDDPHVIALAQISGTRLLCTHDQALHDDFKNRELIRDPRGSVYQRNTHAHLLQKLGTSQYPTY